ncbi:MAG: alpha/beta fold hydrolase [Candidatus Limnocylindria bacterium]
MGDGWLRTLDPEGRGRDISVGRQADHLLAWLEELGVDRVTLVGHDLGGGVAQIAATRAPDWFAGMVLTRSPTTRGRSRASR